MPNLKELIAYTVERDSYFAGLFCHLFETGVVEDFSIIDFQLGRATEGVNPLAWDESLTNLCIDRNLPIRLEKEPQVYYALSEFLIYLEGLDVKSCDCTSELCKECWGLGYLLKNDWATYENKTK